MKLYVAYSMLAPLIINCTAIPLQLYFYLFLSVHTRNSLSLTNGVAVVKAAAVFRLE